MATPCTRRCSGFGHERAVGQDAALEGPATGVRITAEARAALERGRCGVDFSLPQGIAAHAEACLERRVALLVGATGLDAARPRDAREPRRARFAVLIAPNTSIGVAVMTHLLEAAARALGAGYDAEISEAHHRMKRDAPSGTALAWGEAIARARGADLERARSVRPAGKPGPRKPGSIGFASIRAGDIVGRAYGGSCRGRGAYRAHAPGPGPDGVRPRRARGRRVAGGASAGALRHAGRAGILLRCCSRQLHGHWSRASLIFAPGKAAIESLKREDVLEGAPPALHICGTRSCRGRREETGSVDTCSAGSRRWHRVPWRFSRRKRQHDR